MTRTAVERRWAESLLGAMVPGLRPSALAAFWPTFDGAAAPLLAVGFRAAVLLLALLGPLLFLGRLRLFPSLTPDEQERLLVRAAASRSFLVRQLLVTLKVVACFAHLRDPHTRRRLEVVS